VKYLLDANAVIALLKGQERFPAQDLDSGTKSSRDARAGGLTGRARLC
jgi:hypothetical protein